MKQFGIRIRKNHYNFGILTVVIVFTMLCITATSCVTMLTAYIDYQKAVERSNEVQDYYNNHQFESEEP